MSSVAAALRLRARPAWLRIAVPADAVALGTLTALSVLLVAATWLTWGDLGKDTGYDLLAGARTADGQLPYVDYVYYYGPLAPALLGLAFLVGGTPTGAAIALGLAIAAGIVLATYALARELVSPLGAFLAAAITVPVAFGPTNFSFVLPHTFSASLAVLALLCFLLGIARYARNGRRGWLVAAGFSAGLVGLTRPEFELAMIAAAGAWLGLRLIARRSGVGEIALFAAPAALVPAAVYGAFLSQVSLHTLLYENLFPVDELEAAGNNLVSIQAPLTLASFAELGGRLLLYAAGCAALLAGAAALSRSESLRRTAALAALPAALLVAAASVVRPETLRHGLQFVYGWIPAGAALAVLVLLWRFRRRIGEWSAAAQVALAGTIVLAVLGAKTYAAFFVHAPKAQKAAYALPFAAIFLARLHLVELARRRFAAPLGALWLAFLAAAGVGLTLKDASAESATVRGPGGALAAKAGDAEAYRSALRWIAAGTARGDSVLLAPQLTALYVLAERENPLPQLSLLPGALPEPADEKAAIARLERAGTRILVIDRRTFPEYGHTSFGDSFDRRLAGWIDKHFVRATTVGGPAPGSRVLDIWVRRPS